jgi:hypothetical protein
VSARWDTKVVRTLELKDVQKVRIEVVKIIHEIDFVVHTAAHILNHPFT